jgi:hypothetical protein
MLRQRIDAQQGLIPPGPLPVRQDLTTTEDSPLPDELKSPGLETTGQHVTVRRDRGTAASMVGVKVCYWVIPLVPVHVDHDPVKRADTRHALTLAASAIGFRSKAGPFLRSACSTSADKFAIILGPRQRPTPRRPLQVAPAGAGGRQRDLAPTIAPLRDLLEGDPRLAVTTLEIGKGELAATRIS